MDFKRVSLMHHDRLRQLDALRGIAALFVVCNHYFLAVPDQVRLAVSFYDFLSPGSWTSLSPWLRFTPFRLVVDGGAAVDLFFVLSGFVLSLPVTQVKQPAFWPFIVKRLCRIYLPFATITLIIAAAYAKVPVANSEFVSKWLNDLAHPPADYSLAAHLLMTGRSEDMVLNIPMWTLVHEIRMSAFFLVIFLAIRKLGGTTTVAICMVISAISSFGMTSVVVGSWQATLHFLWMFAVGSALAFHREQLIHVVTRCNKKMTGLLWIFALGLLIIPFDRAWADFLIGGGAALLITLCLSKSRITEWLTTPLPLWLGRVSYSLYLIHLPILVLAVTSGFTSGISIWSFLLTLALAELSYRMIEAPMHRIGIMLSRVMRTRQLDPRPV
jgi:peptidoglycan/LPS O-acetylase OafA/YrhL